MPKSNLSNLIGLDYLKEATKFQSLNYPIIDVHSHINGEEAAKIYMQVAKLYGIRLTYSMTQLEQIDNIKSILGKSIRFIAMPKFVEEERNYNNIKQHLISLEQFYDKGARIFKFWSAPRGLDIGDKAGYPDLLKLNSMRRKEIMRSIESWGVILMVHVSDPDTWFKTKYIDSSRYGTKLEQYRALEEILDSFNIPVIAAHMGGWPENLDFLFNLLNKHPNLYIDTSATKWMVRELSKHSRGDLLSFLNAFKGRVLFGSDIVTNDTHIMEPLDNIGNKGETPLKLCSIAFDLYASRYWALRTLFESNYNDNSPIADPDLAMVEPDKYTENNSPTLKGHFLPSELLESIYYKASFDLLERLHHE